MGINNIWPDQRLNFAETLLYDATRLVVRAATRGGTRFSLDWVPDLVFRAMADELEAQGVPRKVAADMNGVAPRTYHRHLAELVPRPPSETLWSRVVAILAKGPIAQAALEAKFAPMDPGLIRSIIYDLKLAGRVTELDDSLRLEAAIEPFDDEELLRFVNHERMLRDIDLDRVAALSGRTAAEVQAVLDGLGDDPYIQASNEGESAWNFLTMLGLQYTHAAIAYLDGVSTRENGMGIFVQPLPDGDEALRDETLEHVQRTYEQFKASAPKQSGVADTAARWAFIYSVGEQAPLADRAPDEAAD